MELFFIYFILFAFLDGMLLLLCPYGIINFFVQNITFIFLTKFVYEIEKWRHPEYAIYGSAKNTLFGIFIIGTGVALYQAVITGLHELHQSEI